MNTDEATVMLRLRRDLTGESFNDGTVAAWSEALGAWPTAAVRVAIVDAARGHQRVSVAHVVERLPARARRPDTPPVHCELCAGTGLVSAPPARAHNPRVCHPTEERPCICHAAEPCGCSAGERARPMLARILEHNDRTRPRHLDDEPAPPAGRDVAEQLDVW
jgi:hypothetical protein